MRQIRNRAATLAALAVLASCSNDDSPARPDSPTSDGSASSSPPAPGYTVVGETHLFGPGRWALAAVGDPEAPLAVFDVPAGYQAREIFVWTHDELDLAEQMGQVMYWAPKRVLLNPCDVDKPSPRLGSTVADLAEALVAQELTTTTRPTPVTLGGYQGLYLELISRTCTPDSGMVIWKAGPGEGRVLEFSATERYWILDVEGHRVVVSAMTPAGARSESVERVTDVAEGITFVEAADSSSK